MDCFLIPKFVRFFVIRGMATGPLFSSVPLVRTTRIQPSQIWGGPHPKFGGAAGRKILGYPPAVEAQHMISYKQYMLDYIKDIGLSAEDALPLPCG